MLHRLVGVTMRSASDAMQHRYAVRLTVVIWLLSIGYSALCAEDGSEHWAFRPVIKPAVPKVEHTAWPRTPIDRFVLAQQEQLGVEPSPQAQAETVLRRVTLDLIGLPPTPEEIAEFVVDPSPEAYARVVERLLSSPHFGERWGRHWLDLARYADSAGYEFDAKREIWKYRDWVIEGLNEDKPYDEFLIEQLAGDLITPVTDQRLIATGFNCNALKQASDLEETMVDRVSTFGTAYLGLTLGCARCHDHKFDPISQTEFCQLYAFFNQADDVEHDFASPDEIAARQALKRQIAQLKRELATYQLGPDPDPLVWAARLTVDDLGALSQDVRDAMGILSKDRTPAQLETVRAAHQQALNGFRRELKERVDRWADSLGDEQRSRLDAASQQYLSKPPEERSADLPSPLTNEYWKHDPGIQKRREVVAQLEASMPQTERTLVMRERTDNPKTYDMLDREIGDEVLPGVPAVLPPLPAKNGPPDRLDLARWAASRENPLTARVAVNRIWQRYFGTGLVETSENFGLQASPPSHPELLDWLAAELMDHGWSQKHIHRLIVTSATYLQSSRSRPDLIEADPENRLLARQNRVRLEAEIIRDAALASSGLLERSVGGPSVFPHQADGIMNGRADGTQWKASEAPQRFRRGMYTHFWRLTPHPYLRLFDAPDAVESCPRRTRSNTPLQALTLLNDPWFMEAAVALASRTLTRMPTANDEARLDWAFQACVGRSPQPDEFQVLVDLLSVQRQSFYDDPVRARAIVGDKPSDEDAVQQAAWTSVARAMLNLDEFVTRE